MEETKESLDDHNILFDEEPENKRETATNNKMPENKVSIMEDNYLYASNVTDTKENGICCMQRDDQNKNVDFGKREVYTTAIDAILNEESVSENIDEMDQLESTRISPQSTTGHPTINENEISGNSSSDEDILQTRYLVENKIYEGECNVPKSSDSFENISDKENNKEKDSEIMETPIMAPATVDNKKKSVDSKTNDSNSEIEQLEKNKDQETSIDITDNIFLNIEADNSNMDTESSYVQNSITNNNEDLPLIEINDASDILIQEFMKSTMNEINFNQNTEEINGVSTDLILEDFFNGTLDASIFKSEKKSPMIKGAKKVTEENQLMKVKHSPQKQQKRRRNVRKNSSYNKKRYSLLDNNNKAEHEEINDDIYFFNSTDDSEAYLKRKISRNPTNSKKGRITTGKNKDAVADITSEILNKHTIKPKTRLENKGSKANSQHKQIKNQPKYNDKSTIISNSFGKKEEDGKNSRTKNNTPRIKSHNKDKVFKDFSCKINPFKKSRDSRNCSLIASKKIKDIEKIENAVGYEEIYLDSDNSCSIFNAEKTEDNYKNIFKGGKIYQKFKHENDQFCKEDTISIVSSNSFQFCSKKERKITNNQVTRSNRKFKREFKDILGACHIATKRQLKDEIEKSKNKLLPETNYPDFLVEENGNMYENHYSSRKQVDNRRQSKSKEKSEIKLLKCTKNTDNITSRKNDAINMNLGAMTRSKRKTWDMLEKELLGESKDESLSNATKTSLLKKRSVRKQSIKDTDIYSISDKSVIQTINMPAKRKKYDEKYEIQNRESECLQTPTKNVQKSSNAVIEKIQSKEIVPSTSKNILEKTIAAMEKCTAKFIAPKVSSTEKEWTHSESECDSMINEISIDQKAEFHSNMTLMRNKNKQYYKNEIFAVLKQSNSKKNEKSAPRTVYNDGMYKYGFNNADHLIKKSIITESYSVKNNAEENHKIESHTLISTPRQKQIDPWSRLIKELNLEEQDENNGKDISNSIQCRRPFIYPEQLKQHTNTHSNTNVEIFKQDETENEESELKVLKRATFEEISVLPHHMGTCSDLNGEDICNTNDDESRQNNENAEYTNEKKNTTNNFKPERKQIFYMKEVQKSPKFQLQIKEDGGVKFKKCFRSLSSSSEESEKQKQGSTKCAKKFPENKNKLERENYKRYLNKLFERENLLSKNKLKENNRQTVSTREDKRPKNNLVEEQRKMGNILLAKDEDDLFSISSSDSETVNKKNPGSGLLCDVFDE